MALFGMLAAGAAKGHRDASNANVDLHNAEVKENQKMAWQAKLDEAKRRYDERIRSEDHQREDRHRAEDKEHDLNKTESQREFEMKKQDRDIAARKEVAGMQESGRNARAEKRASSGGGNSVKDLQKLINDDERELRALNEKRFDPMVSQNEDHLQFIQQNAEDLQRSIARRKTLLDAQMSGSSEAPALNLQGLLNQGQR